MSEALQRAHDTAQALWNQVLGLWPERLDLVLGYIAVQTALIALLLVYAVCLRLVRRARERRRRRMYTVWHYLVPEFLCGGLDASYLRHSIRPIDFSLFLEFLRPYLLDVAGSDAERLVEFLNNIGQRRYMERRLGSRSPWRRADAVHYLGLTADAETIPLLRKALDDSAEVVVYQAAEALMRLHDFESIDAVLLRVSRLSEANRERISLYLMEFGTEILPVLQEMLRTGQASPWLMVLALQVLAYHRYTAATWEILDLYTRSQDREVRIACAKALAAIGEPTLVGLFEEMIADADPVVQAQAARALGELDEPSHAALLVPLLRSDDFWLLKQVVIALRRIGELERLENASAPACGPFSHRAREVIREELAEQRLRQQGPAA